MLDNEISFTLSGREILFVVILLGICLVWCAICFIISIRSGEKQDEKCTRKCIHMLRKDFLYMGVIASITVVLLLTLTFATDGNAVNYFSFAGMLSSIILSVVAIFMTINSENESKEAKIQLDKSVAKMEDTAQKLEEAAKEWKESNGSLLNKFDEQKDVFENILSSSQSILEQSKEINRKVDDMIAENNMDFSGNKDGWSDVSQKEIH